MPQHLTRGSPQLSVTCANHKCVISKHMNILLVKLALLVTTLCTDKRFPDYNYTGYATHICTKHWCHYSALWAQS